MKISVDLMINCYEKNYQTVLSASYIAATVKNQRYDFNNVFVVINNVRDKTDTKCLAKRLKREKLISDYYFVADYLPSALKVVGLTQADIKKVKHFFDWALTGAYLGKSKYLLHWDPDISYLKTSDWITPSLKKMEKDLNIFVANPIWEKEIKTRRLESFGEDKKFFYTSDFSDQVFLVRRDDLLQPIYRYSHLYSLRCPLSEFGSTFEKRIDSYMKVFHKIRLTNKQAIYSHPNDSGSFYPKAGFFLLIKHYTYMMIIVIYSLVNFRILKNFRNL